MRTDVVVAAMLGEGIRQDISRKGKYISVIRRVSAAGKSLIPQIMT
jgi:NAD(P)H-hydrate repair Nnr-like enzyme with NAD(P)H-hydrate epimerase domain